MQRLPFTIEAEWREFRDACVAKTAGEHQLRDMRLSFFAGVTALFTTLNAMADADLDDDLFAQVMQDVEKEISAFALAQIARTSGGHTSEN
jgi:hypothetical protein